MGFVLGYRERLISGEVVYFKVFKADTLIYYSEIKE